MTDLRSPTFKVLRSFGRKKGEPEGLQRSLGFRILGGDQADVESWLGRPAGHLLGFSDAPSWAETLTKTDNEIAGLPGSTPIVWAVPLTVSGTTLASVASGAGDTYFDQLAAKYLAARPGSDPIMVRIGWEMQGGSYAWNADGVEADYIAAFRRSVSRFRAKSSRFQFCFNPNWAEGVDPDLVYPGSDVVDDIGLDMYFITAFDQNTGQTPAQVWSYKRTAPYGLDWLVTYAASKGKTISIPEWGVNVDDAEEYISLFAAWIRSNNVSFTSYWNKNSGGNFNDKLSDGQYPITGAAFVAEFGSGAAPWTPYELGSAVVDWYDARDAATITKSGSAVSAWNSKKGTGRGADQGNASFQPVYSSTARNGKPGVTFDGTADYLLQTEATGLPAGNEAVAVAAQVYAPVGMADFKYFFSVGNATSSYALGSGSGGLARWQQGGNFQQSPALPGADRSIVFYAPAGGTVNMTGSVDGDQTPKVASIARTNFASPTRIVLGGQANTGDTVGSFAPVTLQEVLLINRELTQTETDKLHGYLSWKWGLNGSNLEAGHPYKNARP
jgi:hypothetical protein